MAWKFKYCGRIVHRSSLAKSPCGFRKDTCRSRVASYASSSEIQDEVQDLLSRDSPDHGALSNRRQSPKRFDQQQSPVFRRLNLPSKRSSQSSLRGDAKNTLQGQSDPLSSNAGAHPRTSHPTIAGRGFGGARYDSRIQRARSIFHNQSGTELGSELDGKLRSSDSLNAFDAIKASEVQQRVGTERLAPRYPELSAVLSKLKDARHTTNARESLAAWNRCRIILDKIELTDDEIFDDAFAAFLTTFFALRLSENAVEVWNYMHKRGRKPGIKHWNAMLNGCRYAKDVSSMHTIWSRMIAAGVEPDNAIWTTYILGVMLAGNWQAAFQLLESVGDEWKRKDKSLKAELGPVHGAITGSIQLGRNDLVSSIIKWAHQQGLNPTTQTYNILLRPIARREPPEKVREFMSQMRAAGCSPDVSTYAMKLDNQLRGSRATFHLMDAEDQRSVMDDALQEMDQDGIEPGAYIYTIMLNALLFKGSAESPDVGTGNVAWLIRRMVEANIEIPPHALGALFRHYFSQQPPNMILIRKLLEILVDNNPKSSQNLDHIFWDRIISYLAEAGEDELAFKYLRRLVSQEGKSPSWRCLLTLLDAQARKGEWSQAEELVRGVTDGDLMRYGAQRKQGAAQTDFWHLVDDLKYTRRIFANTSKSKAS